jgi:hypothetical protein
MLREVLDGVGKQKGALQILEDYQRYRGPVKKK